MLGALLRDGRAGSSPPRTLPGIAPHRPEPGAGNSLAGFGDAGGAAAPQGAEPRETISSWLVKLLRWRPRGAPATTLQPERQDSDQKSVGENVSLITHASSTQGKITGVLASATFHPGKFRVSSGPLDSSALFTTVEMSGDQIEILLNSAHPAFPLLSHAIAEDSVHGLEWTDARVRLSQLQEAMVLLLRGWAQYERELGGIRRTRAEEAREDWGRVVRRLLCSDDD